MFGMRKRMATIVVGMQGVDHKGVKWTVKQSDGVSVLVGNGTTEKVTAIKLFASWNDRLQKIKHG